MATRCRWFDTILIDGKSLSKLYQKASRLGKKDENNSIQGLIRNTYGLRKWI